MIPAVLLDSRAHAAVTHIPTYAHTRIPQRTALQDALRTEGAVALAYLFGSHAEGRSDGASDVDVAVVRTDDDNALRRVVDLTKKLETVIDRPVDVTFIAVRGTDPRLLGQVLRHGECLFARVEFETRARSKYLDSTDPCAGRVTTSPIGLQLCKRRGGVVFIASFTDQWPHIEEYDRKVREALTR